MTIAEVENNAIKAMDQILRQELAEQGHKNTGAAERSLRGRRTAIPGGHELSAEPLYYVFILDKGVAPNRIPFSFSGRGGTSAYITGLINYFRSKGLSEKEAKGAAFATAQKHKTEGMPSLASYAHSKNGRRTGLIREVDRRVDGVVTKIIMQGMDRIISDKFHETPSETI